MPPTTEKIIQLTPAVELFWDCNPREKLNFGDINRHIHPIFAKENFPEATDEEYANYLPSLNLASHFLDSECFLHFWHDIFYGSLVKGASCEEHQYLPTPRELNFDEKLKTIIVMAHMAQTVKFLPMPEEYHAVNLGMTGPNQQRTSALRGSGVLPPNGVASDIFYNKVGFEIKDTESDAFKLQKRFRIAVLLLHELAHAAQRLLFKMCCEPYYGDATVAESGYELESYMFGGIIRHIDGNERRDAGEYLTLLCRWPNEIGGRVRPGHIVPRSVVAWRIPLSFIQKLFTTQFWETETLERRRAAFVPECKVGWPYDCLFDRLVCPKCCKDFPEDIQSFLPDDCVTDECGNVWKKVDRPDFKTVRWMDNIGKDWGCENDGACGKDDGHHGHEHGGHKDGAEGSEVDKIGDAVAGIEIAN